MSSKIDNYLLKLDEKIKSKLSVNELNKIKLELFDLRKDYSKKSKILLLIAEISWLLLEIEDAIFYFNEALLLNPNSNDAKFRLNKAKKEKADLITYLTFNNPKIETNNPILNANNEIREIKYKITDLDEIPDKLIFEIYEKAHSIVNNYKIDIESEETQIYRKTNLKYNCDRHFKVFNTFQFIPENCFGCYKVQVLPKNVIDLIKLYLAFDNLNLKKTLTRKCMIELRPRIKGPYKGYIYCIGKEEADDVLKHLNPILNKSINKEIPRQIKRGCSEFSLSYPNFINIDSKDKNFMYYDDRNKSKEETIDKVFKSKIDYNLTTLSGINLKDFMIINNWLFYAKLIGDESYKLITNKPKYSKYISDLLN